MCSAKCASRWANGSFDGFVELGRGEKGGAARGIAHQDIILLNGSALKAAAAGVFVWLGG